jgi:hypothetical protein
MGDVTPPNKKSRLSAPPTIGFQPHKSPLGQRSFVMHTQILTQTGTKVKGVFTKRLMKTLSVTLSSVVLLIGFVGSSSADEEDDFTVSMKSHDERYSYSSSGYITHKAQVETNRDFAEVDWYVNEVWQITTKGDGDADTHAEFQDSFNGNGPGKDYTIKAVAYSSDGETVFKSYEITVYKPVVAYSQPSQSGAKGYLEIAESGWRGGPTGAVEMSAHLRNDSTEKRRAHFAFTFEIVLQKLNNQTQEWKPKRDLIRRDARSSSGELGEGEEASCCHHDYYNAEGDGDPGERAKLQGTATLDVWHYDTSVNPKEWKSLVKWDLPAPDAYYEFIED